MKLASLLLFPTLLAAADFNAGIQAFDKGDFTAAQKEWTPLANSGSAAAQFNLGLLYYNGQGVPQDYTEAARWFERSANQGYNKAQHNLGAMYGSGKGVKRDYVQAHKWLNLCAAGGGEACAAQRDLVAKKLNAAKLSEAQRLAREWKPVEEKPKPPAS